MIKIEIEFIGIGLFYRKEDSEGKEVWKAFLPFDQKNCHRVLFSAKKSDETEIIKPVKLAAKKKVLKFSMQGATSFVGEKNFEKVFDLTSENTHSNGLKLKPDWDDHSVLLEIPNIMMNVKDEMLSRYILKDDSGSNEIQLMENKPYNMAYSLLGEIDLEDGGSIQLSDNSGNKVFDSNDWVGEKHFRLKFDNDCLETPAGVKTDIDLLYNTVSDNSPNSRKFIIERRLEDLPPSSFDFAVLGTKSHNPAPGRAGIPCYDCKASNSINLP